MNRLLVAFLISAALLLVPLCMLADETAVAGDVDPGALITVENYLRSLVDGDISGLKSTLSPKLLREKASVLDAPSYDVTLQSFYANATFRIVNASPLGAGRIKVDTEIFLDSGHLMEASFLLVRDADDNYMIDEEAQ